MAHKPLFRAATDADIDTCFANAGTSEMQLVYETGRTKDMHAVLCLQENTVPLTAMRAWQGNLSSRSCAWAELLQRHRESPQCEDWPD